jgi:hypothetical protein
VQELEGGADLILGLKCFGQNLLKQNEPKTS